METPSSGLALIPASRGTESLLLPFLAACPEAQAAAGLSVWRGEGWGWGAGGGGGERPGAAAPSFVFRERGIWSFFLLGKANSPRGLRTYLLLGALRGEGCGARGDCCARMGGLFVLSPASRW